MHLGSCATNDLKECQHICGKDGEMNALDHARGGAQSKPLPNVIQFFSGQSHSVDAKRTRRRRRIEDLRQDLDVGGVVWGVDWLKGRRHSTKRSGDNTEER